MQYILIPDRHVQKRIAPTPGKILHPIPHRRGRRSESGAAEPSGEKNPQVLELLVRTLERQGKTETAGRAIQAALSPEPTGERRLARFP